MKRFNLLWAILKGLYFIPVITLPVTAFSSVSYRVSSRQNNSIKAKVKKCQAIVWGIVTSVVGGTVIAVVCLLHKRRSEKENKDGESSKNLDESSAPALVELSEKKEKILEVKTNRKGLSKSNTFQVIEDEKKGVKSKNSKEDVENPNRISLLEQQKNDQKAEKVISSSESSKSKDDIGESSDEKYLTVLSDAPKAQIPSLKDLDEFFSNENSWSPLLDPYKSSIQSKDRRKEIKEVVNYLRSKLGKTDLENLQGLRVELALLATSFYMNGGLPCKEDMVKYFTSVQDSAWELALWYIMDIVKKGQDISSSRKEITKRAIRFCFNILKEVYEDSKSYIEEIAAALTGGLQMKGAPWIIYGAYILVGHDDYEKVFNGIKERVFQKQYTFTYSNQGKEYQVVFDPQEAIPHEQNELNDAKRNFLSFLRRTVQAMFFVAYYEIVQQIILDEATIHFEPQSAVQFNLTNENEKEELSKGYYIYPALKTWLREHKVALKEEDGSDSDSDNEASSSQPTPSSIEVSYFQAMSFNRIELDYHNTQLRVGAKMVRRYPIFRDLQTGEDII